jgi:hypothetical protein
MRLWTIHPKYLDAKGLVALWREALLAQRVLQGLDARLPASPQLSRFLATRQPAAALAGYLAVVHQEASRRGYSFDAGKIGRDRFRDRIVEMKDQLLYEWEHLQRKLAARNPARLRDGRPVAAPEPQLFRIVRGKVRAWQKVRVGNATKSKLHRRARNSRTTTKASRETGGRP